MNCGTKQKKQWKESVARGAKKKKGWVLTLILGVLLIVLMMAAGIHLLYMEPLTVSLSPLKEMPKAPITRREYDPGVKELLEAMFDKPADEVMDEEIAAIQYLKMDGSEYDGSYQVIYSRENYYDYNEEEFFDSHVEMLEADCPDLEMDSLTCFEGLRRLTIIQGPLNDIGSFRHLKNLKGLFLYETISVTDLTAFGKLPDLEGVGIDYVDSVEGIENLPNLKELELQHSNISDIDKILAVDGLEELDISYNYMLRSLEGIQHMPSLKRLYLFDLSEIMDLSAITECQDLETLYLDLDYVEQLPDLSSMVHLENLYLAYFYDFIDLHVEELSGLKRLFLYDGNFDERNFNQICTLDQLERLEIVNCKMFCPTDALENLQNLKHLNLSMDGLMDLDFMKGFQKLEYLDMSYNNLTDLSPVAELEHLSYLDISGNPVGNMRVLDELKDVEIVNDY